MICLAPKEKKVYKTKTINTMHKIDDIDRKIIDCLREDGRTSFRELSKKVGVKEGTIRLRFNNLMKEKIILGFTSTVDERAIDLRMHALLFIKTKLGKAEEVAKKLAQMEEVRFCAITTGLCDIIIEMFTGDSETFSKFINKKIASIEGVLEAQTNVVLKTYKVNYIKSQNE